MKVLTDVYRLHDQLRSVAARLASEQVCVQARIVVNGEIHDLWMQMASVANPITRSLEGGS